MDVSEFSAEFDVLFNNITSNQAPGLNNYEKSIFLTNAEYALVNEYFNPVTDSTNGGFDRSPRRQTDFETLIKWETIQPTASAVPYDDRALTYEMPTDVLFILNEQLVEYDETVKRYQIIPLSYKEYRRLMSKPYKYPLKGQVWRLITDMQSVSIIELIGRNLSSSAQYKMRYVRKPQPIILENLSNYGVSIDGVQGITQCELPAEMHREILERAVTLAKIAWQGGTMTQYAVNASKEK